jgi:hypothetical protein
VRIHILMVAAVVALAFTGCSSDETIRCSKSADCLQGGIPGTCEPSTAAASAEHWCAFPDLSCAGSQERWGIKSGDGLAGDCVATEVPDAAVADAAVATCTGPSAKCSGNTVERCDATGHPLPDETCLLGCVAATASVEAHCLHVVPSQVPDACDGPAATALFEASGTHGVLDTDDGTICTGGILVQAQGPAICIIRYGTFRIPGRASLKVVGSRALALVVDGDLTVDGTLDGSADLNQAGPGALPTNGHGGGTLAGAGGGGYTTAGGAGGAITSSGAAGGTGGVAINPALPVPLQGGFAGAIPSGICASTRGGGGGGALTLISCKGTLIISGNVDAGGGGGEPGQLGGQFAPCGGAGGGTGGTLVLQGAGIRVTGGVFANGGGGGAGCAGSNTAAGEDGSRSTTAPASGGLQAACTIGGAGGIATMVPAPGADGTGSNPGAGGGGSVGRIEVFVPAGVTPNLVAAQASPFFDAKRTLMAR